MAHLFLTSLVNAPLEKVFDVYTDLEKAADRIDGIVRLEVMTDGPVGEGTRFRETRVMFKKEATEEMEITRFEPPKGYAVEADSCGAHIRTEFRFLPGDDGSSTKVELELNTTNTSFFAKIMAPLGALMMGPMKKVMQKDLDDLKRACEEGV